MDGHLTLGHVGEVGLGRCSACPALCMRTPPSPFVHGSTLPSAAAFTGPAFHKGLLLIIDVMTAMKSLFARCTRTWRPSHSLISGRAPGYTSLWSQSPARPVCLATACDASGLRRIEAAEAVSALCRKSRVLKVRSVNSDE